jgi:hypothetical protein
MVVAQVWRGRQGRQANLARLLRAVDVRVVSQRDGRDADGIGETPQIRVFWMGCDQCTPALPSHS